MLPQPIYNFVAESAAYTAKPGEYVLASATTSFDVTLPPVATRGPVGVRVVKVAATKSVTVKTSDTSKIDGVAGATGIAYSTLHTGAVFASDGSDWYVVAS